MLKLSSMSQRQDASSPAQSKGAKPSIFSRAASRVLLPAQRAWYGRAQKKFTRDLSFADAAEAFPDRNDLYAYMHHYLHHLAPPELREHRAYFQQEMRGFGEDA